MARNPRYSVPVDGYIDPALKKRMERVRDRAPRLTISRQVERSLAAYVPTMEAEAGITIKQRTR